MHCLLPKTAFRISLIAIALFAAALPCLANEVVLFALNDAAALESLRLYGGRASAVSPQWFAAAADGSISGMPSARLMEACRDLDLAVTPAVMNRDFSPQAGSALLASKKARARFARELVQRARRYGFHGYIIDFENLPVAGTRKNFNHLLDDLRREFRRAKLSLAVALPAPSAANLRTYDYKATARLADRIVLMAYDQHGRFNLPGPIAGYGWVETALRETLKHVPAKKLLLGIAFYHRNWGEAGVTAGSYKEAVILQQQHGAQMQWNPSYRAHWFGFSADGRVHTVWMEDGRSVAEKLALARHYRLAGVAGWRLGQEDPSVWVMLRQFMKK